MKLIFLISCFLIVNFISATEIETYFQQYKENGRTDYSFEQNYIQSNTILGITEKLSPYFYDTLNCVRQKAYYFVYKRGVVDENNAHIAVNKLLDGCSDIKYGAVIGQNLLYLQEFKYTDFNDQAKSRIRALLAKEKMPHYKKLAMLAGFVHAGEDVMRQLLLVPDITKEKKWALSLALSRHGDPDATRFCLSLVKRLPVTNELVMQVFPELIYTRQKSIIAYCVEVLMSEDGKCYSSDPDNQESILCGYYIMEQLAPAISNFPYKVNSLGSLETDDYEKALKTVRNFFNINPMYEIDFENF